MYIYIFSCEQCEIIFTKEETLSSPWFVELKFYFTMFCKILLNSKSESSIQSVAPESPTNEIGIMLKDT